jgi:thioredoxin 1
MTKLQIITLSEWKSQILSEEKPLLVDFQAPWCSPLLLQYEALLKLSEEVRGEVEILQLDITRVPSVAMTYRLIDFPTLGLFYKGELLKLTTGIGRMMEMKKILKPCLSAYFGKKLRSGTHD